jgi:hypothetical protein
MFQLGTVNCNSNFRLMLSTDLKNTGNIFHFKKNIRNLRRAAMTVSNKTIKTKTKL